MSQLTVVTPSASSVRAGKSASLAFDGQVGPDRFWWSDGQGPQWLQADLGSGVAEVATWYNVAPYPGDTGAPTAWTFEGSNNGSSWTVLDTRSSVSYPNQSQSRTFSFTNTTAYRYYRLNISSPSGSGPGSGIGLAVAELRIGTGDADSLLFGEWAPTSSLSGSYTIGVVFVPAVNGYVTKYRGFKNTDDSTVTFNLWNSSGTSLASQTFDQSPVSDQHWYEVELTTPIAVTAGTPYMVSCYYPVNSSFVSGSQGSDLVHGDVKIPALGSVTFHGATTNIRYASGNAYPNLAAGDRHLVGVQFSRTLTTPTIFGTVSATMPALSASAAGTVALPPYTGTVAGTLPALTGSAAGTHTSNDQVGTVAGNIPALSASAAGTVTVPPVTGSVTGTLPALTGTASGQLGIGGTVAGTLPALTGFVSDLSTDAVGTVAGSLPSLTGALVAYVETDGGTPWTDDLEGRALLPIDTSGHATWTPPLATPPAGFVERSVVRASRVVPDLRTITGVVLDPQTGQPRIPASVWNTLPLAAPVEDMGVPHVIFHHLGQVVDATYFRGIPTEIGVDRREEPFGDATCTLRFPGITTMDEEPDNESHPLWFQINRAQFEIVLVKEGSAPLVLWAGHIVSRDLGNDDTRPALTLTCVGSLRQASTDLHRPIVFQDPIDVGTLVPRSLNAVTARRYPSIAATTTGILSTKRGSWDDNPLSFAQELLSTAWTSGGNQWTVAKVEGTRRTYEMRLKKTTPEWTVTNGAQGVNVSLTRDSTSIRNVIFGHGVGPDGYSWWNYHYPGLHSDTAPGYPYSNPSNVISVGTTDASTTSGDGVSAWQRRARDLGYKLTIDGVFNTSDAEVARTIQRRYGLSVDGIVGPQTWNASFGVGSNIGSLTSPIRLPLAADPRTQYYLYNADGSRAGQNPDWDGNVIVYADNVDFGTGITRAQGIASAQQILARESEPGLVGRITLKTDPREGSRFLIPVGDKITLVGFEGADRVLHITAIERDWQNLTVTLEVDERSRDAMTQAQIIQRNREARRDPARRPGNPNKRSRLDVDQVVPFDGESGAGRVPKHALNGGLWTVVRIPVSELGRVAVMDFQTTPAAKFAVFLFGKPITPAQLRAYVGTNPLALDDPGSDHREILEDRFGWIEGWGRKDDAMGYWPEGEGNQALNGRWRDTGGFEFVSARPPWVWVAEYSPSSCFIEGQILPAPVV